MAHLQTDGAQVFSRWHNDGMTGYRKRPRHPAQLTKLMIDIGAAMPVRTNSLSAISPSAMRCASPGLSWRV